MQGQGAEHLGVSGSSLIELPSPVREVGTWRVHIDKELSLCRVCWPLGRSQGIHTAYIGAFVTLENSHVNGSAVHPEICIADTPNISGEGSLHNAWAGVSSLSTSQPGLGSEGGGR